MQGGTGRSHYKVSATVGGKRYEERGRDKQDIPLALDRLDNDGGRVFGSGLLAQEQVELVLGLTDDFLFRCRLRDTERVPVRVGGGKHAGLPYQITATRTPASSS
jgi:hypothetical protein